MRIDLHVHTREGSACARSASEEMIRAAIDEGLDGLVITDHDCLLDDAQLDYLNAKYAPFRLFRGTEITTRREHFLVLGVDDERLEVLGWAYPELHAFVNDRGGFLAPAHPFRFNPHCIEADLDRYPPHALEAYSWNTPASAAPRIRDVAARLGVPVLSNSDAHCPVIAIHGDYDPHPAEGVRDALSRVLQRFQFVLLDRCGHKPWIERWAREAFFEALEEAIS